MVLAGLAETAATYSNSVEKLSISAPLFQQACPLEKTKDVQCSLPTTRAALDVPKGPTVGISILEIPLGQWLPNLNLSYNHLVLRLLCASESPGELSKHRLLGLISRISNSASLG